MKKLDDLRKRDLYRKAHGIRDPQGFWGFGRRLEYYVDEAEVEKEFGKAEQAENTGGVSSETAVGDGEYKESSGRRRPIKKWFGIW